MTFSWCVMWLLYAGGCESVFSSFNRCLLIAEVKVIYWSFGVGMPPLFGCSVCSFEPDSCRTIMCFRERARALSALDWLNSGV